ncbi:hypothetical protein ACOSP7_020822 [Xanthoceras sorbifolium]
MVNDQTHQDGLAAAKLNQASSADAACTQLLTNTAAHARVTASKYIASSQLKSQLVASVIFSSDKAAQDHLKSMLRRSDVCVGD